MKIVFFEIEEWERKTFYPLEQDHEVVYVNEPLTLKNIEQYASAEIISPFIYSGLSQDVLSRMENLQCIATRSTGWDHIALDYCKERGICVSNVPVYGENTVAEHVFALLLALSHRIIEAADRTQKGDFSSKGLEGFDLQGKTLGVIGTGHIGRDVIRIAQGFQMNVLAYDVMENAELAKELGFSYVDKEALLSRSDVISLHIPGSKENVNYLDDAAFGLMKEGAVVINTARGDLVNVQALLRALVSGKVRGAGLDVLPDEPIFKEEAELLRVGFRKEQNLETLLANHTLLNMRNVVITPHNAFHTREAVQRILDTTLENINAFIEGACLNAVTS